MIGLVLLFLWDVEDSSAGEGKGDVWEIFCVCVSLTGFVIRAIIIGHTPAGTSGRNTREQRADQLNVSGFYSIVRHPLYLGNFMTGLGFSLFPGSWPLVLIYFLAFWLYYERIICAEESYLREKFGASFAEWSSKTPAFIPNPRSWISWSLPFSMKNVLKREYNGFFAIFLIFFLFEQASDLFSEGAMGVDTGWIWFLATGAVVWTVVRTVKKQTSLFNVEGR